MGLRDRLKSSVKSRVTSKLRSASDPVAAAGRAGASARERARQAQAALENVDAGDVPEDERREQAARAQRTAQMTAPIPGARLDPVDIPHPFNRNQQGRRPGPDQRNDGGGLEAFVTGNHPGGDDGGQTLEQFAMGGGASDEPTLADMARGRANSEEASGPLTFDDSDDDRGGLY